MIREESVWENLKDIKIEELSSGPKVIPSILASSIHNSITADKLFPSSPTIEYLHDPTKKKHMSATSYRDTRSKDRLDLKKSTERIDSMLKDKSKRASNPVNSSESIKMKKEISIDESLQKAVAAKMLLKNVSSNFETQEKADSLIEKPCSKASLNIRLPDVPDSSHFAAPSTVETVAISPDKIAFVLQMTDPQQFDAVEVLRSEDLDMTKAVDKSEIISTPNEGGKMVVSKSGGNFVETAHDVIQTTALDSKVEAHCNERAYTLVESPSVKSKQSNGERQTSAISNEQKTSNHSKLSEIEKTSDTPVTNLDLGSSSTDMKPLKIEKASSSFYAKMSNVIHNSKEKLSASLERLNLSESTKKNIDGNSTATPVFTRKDDFGSNQSIDHPDALVKPSTIKRLEMLGSRGSLERFFTSVSRKNTFGDALEDKSKPCSNKKSNSGLSRENSVPLTINSDILESTMAATATFMHSNDRENSKNFQIEKEGSTVGIKSPSSNTSISPSHSHRSMIGSSSSHNPLVLRTLGKRQIIPSERISISPSISTINPRAQDSQRQTETMESSLTGIPFSKRTDLSPGSKFGSIADIQTGVVSSPSMQTIIPRDGLPHPSNSSGTRKTSSVPSEMQPPSQTSTYRRQKASGLSISTTSSQGSPPASPTATSPELNEARLSMPLSPVTEQGTRRKKQVMKFSVTLPISSVPGPKRPQSNFYSENSTSGIAQMLAARPQSQQQEKPISMRFTQASPFEPVQTGLEEHGIVSNKAVQARLAASKTRFKTDDDGSKESSPKGSSTSINNGMKTEATIFKPAAKPSLGSGTSLDKAILRLGKSAPNTNSSSESLSREGNYKVKSGSTNSINKSAGTSPEISRNTSSSRINNDNGSPKTESPSSKLRFFKKDALSVNLPQPSDDQSANHRITPSEASVTSTLYPNKPKHRQSDALSPTLSPIASVSDSFLESKINALASPVQNIPRPLSILSTNAIQDKPVPGVTSVQSSRVSKATSPLSKESSSQEFPSQVAPPKSNSTAPRVPSNLHRKQDSGDSMSSSVREIQEFSSMLGGLFGEGSSLFGESKGEDPFKFNLESLKEEKSEDRK